MGVLSILNEVNQAGGLPLTATFTAPSSSSGSYLLAVAGSAWSNQPSVTLTVQVLLGSLGVVGTMTLCSNFAGEHRAFAPVYLPVSLTGGTSYTLTLQDLAGSPTITDVNDWFSAALIW